MFAPPVYVSGCRNETCIHVVSFLFLSSTLLSVSFRRPGAFVSMWIYTVEPWKIELTLEAVAKFPLMQLSICEQVKLARNGTTAIATIAVL